MFKTIAGDIRDGFMVVKIDDSRGVWSFTGDMYPSRTAWEMGNENAVFACGQLRDETIELVPILKPFLALHLQPIEMADDPAFSDFRAWLDMLPDAEVPDFSDIEEWEHTFDNGVTVTARFTGEEEAKYVSYPAWINAYEVIVKCDDIEYRTTFGGSIMDCSNGVVNAREAAFGVLREMHQYAQDGFEEIAEMIDGFTVRSEEQARNLVAMIEASDALADKFDEMLDILGI